jgi:transposase
MRYYAGLDISMKETAICIVDEEGKIVHECIQVTDPKSIAKCLEKTKLNIVKVGLEIGSISRWLTLKLRELNINAIAIDTRLMNGILKITVNKTDENDARGIANAIRAGMYTEVHLRSDENVELTILLTTRHTLVSQRTRMILTIRGHLKSIGIRPGPFSYKNAEERLQIHMQELTEPIRESVKTLLKIIEKLNEEIEVMEKQIKANVKDNEDVKLLQSIDGVGPILSSAFVAAIDDPHRFINSRAVPAYFGLTPRQYASGETQIMGKISKCGNAYVRSLLYEGANCILTRTSKWSKLKAWGMKIQRKHGYKKAVIAVARKLATIMYRMLITRKDFIHGEPKRKKDKTTVTCSELKSKIQETTALVS